VSPLRNCCPVHRVAVRDAVDEKEQVVVVPPVPVATRRDRRPVVVLRHGVTRHVVEHIVYLEPPVAIDLVCGDDLHDRRGVKGGLLDLGRGLHEDLFHP
jgi:hypothetical protein